MGPGNTSPPTTMRSTWARRTPSSTASSAGRLPWMSSSTAIRTPKNSANPQNARRRRAERRGEMQEVEPCGNRPTVRVAAVPFERRDAAGERALVEHLDGTAREIDHARLRIDRQVAPPARQRQLDL